MKQCRCCKINLANKDYRDIHGTPNMGMPPTYAQLIKKFTDVNIDFDDELPQKMCVACCDKLKNVFEFVTIARKADEHLKTQMKTPIVSKHCRCCLTTTANEYQDIPKLYAKLINDVADVEIKNDDGLTQKLCTNCFVKVRNISDFGLTIRNTNTELTKPWKPILVTECRCCRKANAKKYHSVYEQFENGQTIAEFIEKLTEGAVQIQPDDGLSQRICEDHCFYEIRSMVSMGSFIRANVEHLTKIVSETNEKQVCRCCLDESTDDDYYPVYEDWKGGPTYGDYMELIANVKINHNDGLSQVVCPHCAGQLRGMMSFVLYSIVLTNEQLKKPWKKPNYNYIYSGMSSDSDSD